MDDLMTTRETFPPEALFALHQGDGFHLLVPKGATQNEASDHGRWRYHDFLFRVSPEEAVESTGIFYYWTVDPPTELDLSRARSLCREVIRRHLFEGAFRLRMITGLAGVLGSNSSLVLKFRFSAAAPEVNGPMNLYTVHDTAQSWFFVLGVFTEQGGDANRETEIIEMLEHEVVMSLQLDR